MLIKNCQIVKVETEERGPNDEKVCSAVAKFKGTLTRELAETLCGRDGAAALFSRMSYLKSGPVARSTDKDSCEIILHHAKDEHVLPSCGVDKYHVNGEKEKVTFRVSCERAADMLFNFKRTYPEWQGDVEIRALQGSLFADEPAEEHTGEDGETLFKGTPDDMAAVAEGEERRTRPARKLAAVGAK